MYRAYRGTRERTAQHTRGSVGRLLTSPGCWEKSLAEGPEGPCLQLEPSVSAPVRRGGPEPGRIGIPCEIAWNDSSHSILNEFMHAEYGIFVYTIWPLFRAAPPSTVGHREGKFCRPCAQVE